MLRDAVSCVTSYIPKSLVAPEQSRIPSLSVLRRAGALTFGYKCTVYVGVDVEAGDAEVDVIDISFIVSVQYIGY